MKEEPRWMTMGDAMALSAGVALSFALLSDHSVYDFVPADGSSGLGRMLRLIQGYRFAQFLRILQGVALTLGCVALARQMLHRRNPRPSEWLILMLGLWRQADLDSPERHADPSDPLLDCLFVGVGAALISSCGIGLPWALRRVIPPWLRTCALAGLAYFYFLVPLEFISQEGVNLFAPAGGFGPSDTALLQLIAYRWLALIPTGQMFAVPAVAAASYYAGRRPSVWSDWACLGTSILVGLLSAVSYRGEFHEVGWAWVAERGMALAWLVVVVLLARLTLVRVVPPFWRWIGGDQGESSPSATS